MADTLTYKVVKATTTLNPGPFYQIVEKYATFVKVINSFVECKVTT